MLTTDGICMDRQRSYLARVTEVEAPALVETGYVDHYNISFNYELSFAKPRAVFWLWHSVPGSTYVAQIWQTVQCRGCSLESNSVH